jgi:hypothetical protein
MTPASICRLKKIIADFMTDRIQRDPQGMEGKEEGGGGTTQG